MMIPYTTVLLSLSLLSSLLFLGDIVEAKDRLYFNENGTFKVVQFTDLHFGESDDGDLNSRIVQGNVLGSESPDLVVITGDLVSGYAWDKQQGWYESHWNQLIQPMVSRNIKWAIALGNHDVEADLTGTQVVQLDSSNPLSLTQLGPTSLFGASNYYLPIYMNSSTDEIGFILWIFDSGQNGCMGVDGWGCIHRNQIAWYQNESATLQEKSGRIIPGAAFFHIPLYEHLDLYNTRPVYGKMEEDEGVCCSSVNTGLYAAMKETANIKNVFCGHDHDNDYIGDYFGINLGYGRKTGYGGYGPPYGWQRGARVIEITQNQFDVNTWLRLEDKSKATQSLTKPSGDQFVGCCSMEGHGKEKTSKFVYVLWGVAVVIMVAVIAVVGYYIYLRKRTPTDGKNKYTPVEALELEDLVK